MVTGINRNLTKRGASQLYIGVSVLALTLSAQPAWARDATDTTDTTQAAPAPKKATPSKPASAGSPGTFSGTAAPDAATAPTSPDAASSTSGTSGSSPQTPNVKSDSDGDAIVVTGIRQSLSSAQSIKRNSDTVVDAITAEDIGALPDRSVNEALQRVPGVAISRFAAPNDSQHFSVEGSGVTIRGLSYVRGEFNGRDTFAANAGREIGFNDVPTELVGSVEIFKNLTADLIEGGISGTVNINQRKPFDSKDNLLYLSGSINYGDFEKRKAPSGVALISHRWDLGDGSRIGLLGSVSYSQQYSRSDSVFLASPFPRYNDDTNGNGQQDPGEGRTINAGTPYASTIYDHFPVPAGFSRVYAPTGGGSRTQDFNRKRIGFSGGAQFENADRTLLVTAQFLRADSREDWIEHTIEPNVYYGDVTATFPQGYNPFAPIAGQTFQNYTFDQNGVFTSGTIAHTGGVPFANGQSCNNGTSTYCPLNNLVAGGQFTTFSNRRFYVKSVTQDQSLNIKWSPTHKLHLNFDGQYVFSKATNVDDIVDGATFSQVNIDQRGAIPQITSVTPGFNTAAYYASPGNVYLRDAFNNRAINDGHEMAFRGDAQYDISDDGFLRKLRVGARYADRKQTVRTNDYNNWGAVSDTWTGGGPTFFSRLTAADQAAFTYNNFFRGQAVQPPSATYIPNSVLENHVALEDLLRRATALGGGNYRPLEDRGTNLVDGYFLPGEVYKNRERTYSAYARLDFGTQSFSNGMRLSGNIGLRFVHTKDDSIGSLTLPQRNSVLPTDNPPAGTPPRYTTVAGYCAFSLAQQQANPNPSFVLPAICTVSPAQQDAAVAFANGASFADVASQSFNKYLPSLNLKLDLTPKLLMRFAASKAISRPNFGNLRDYIGVSPSGSNSTGNFSFSASSQNPYLKPIDTTQFDLTAEWYFAKVGSLTGALFYKKLSNIIIDNSSYVRPVTNNGQTFNVSVNGPANAPGHSNIKGFEAAYQQTYDFLPGPLRGLGAQATFTFIKAGKIPNGNPANAPNDGNRPPQDVVGLYDNLPLAGLSKYNYNLSVFYDLAGLYARVAYSWRSKFLLTNRDCCFPFLPVYSLATGQMDASLFYTFNKHFKFGLEAQNLLDTTNKTTFLLNGNGLEAPRSYFKSDRSFTLSARLTF